MFCPISFSVAKSHTLSCFSLTQFFHHTAAMPEIQKLVGTDTAKQLRASHNETLGLAVYVVQIYEFCRISNSYHRTQSDKFLIFDRFVLSRFNLVTVTEKQRLLL